MHTTHFTTGQKNSQDATINAGIAAVTQSMFEKSGFALKKVDYTRGYVYGAIDDINVYVEVALDSGYGDKEIIVLLSGPATDDFDVIVDYMVDNTVNENWSTDLFNALREAYKSI